MVWDCVVVGGGPSGMMAAITAARRGIRVLLLEHMEMVGKKILSTGNGKCNLTNENIDENCYYCENKELIIQALNRFSYQNTIDFFREIGVYTKSINGYIYPVTAQATTIRTALENQLYYSGVERKCKIKINSIKHNKIYEIECSDELITANQVILATGLKAAPNTGSDGSGIKLCEDLGIRIRKVLPSLDQLKSSSEICKIVGNVRNTGIAKLYIEDLLVAQNEGELQFTDYGVSGIPIFQVSHHAIRALDYNKHVVIKTDLAPFLTEVEITEFIKTGINKYPGMNIINYISGIVNNKIAVGIAVAAGLNKDGAALRKLDDELIKKIAYNIKNLEFEITGYRDYDSAQVCQGGVAISELNNDFEVKKLPGLYVVGELMDVDGICGGYNLQWAFTTGYIAGMSVQKYD